MDRSRLEGHLRAGAVTLGLAACAVAVLAIVQRMATSSPALFGLALLFLLSSLAVVGHFAAWRRS